MDFFVGIDKDFRYLPLRLGSLASRSSQEQKIIGSNPDRVYDSQDFIHCNAFDGNNGNKS
jgi:hypothetical protein